MGSTGRLRVALLSATFLTGLGAAASASAQQVVNDPAGPQITDDTAQAGAPPADGEGSDIVVTATRRATTLQDVPINITAIGSEALARDKIDDVRDLGAFTPGLTVTDTGPRGAGSIVLRGLSANDTAATGNNADNALGIYLGEVPLYTDFKLIDLQRVETLIGPQGTLYGLGTLAGAIRYIPNRPDASRIEGEVYGRAYDVAHSKGAGYTGYVMLNLPIVADAIAFRTVTGYYYDPGFIDYPFLLRQPGVFLPQPGTAANPLGTPEQREANFRRGRDLNDERTFTTRNQLGFTLSNFNAYVTYAHQRTKTDGIQANTDGLFGEGRYESARRYAEPADRQSHLISLEAQGQIDDIAQVSFTSAYTKSERYSRADVTDLLIDLDYDYELFPAFSGFTQADVEEEQYNQEVRVVSAHGGPFSWVVGGFWNRLKTRTDSLETTPGLANFFGVFRPDDAEYVSFVETSTDEKAVFGEGTFRIIPQWQVTAGARYYKYDTLIRGGADTPLTSGGRRRMPFPSLTIDPSRIRQGDTGADGVVWKFNTSFDVTPDILIYGTYSKGYRIGGVNRVAPCTFAPPPAPPPAGQNLCAYPFELFYDPDEVKNAEIGVRAQLFNRRLSINASVFEVEWNGIQLDSQTINGAIGIIVNGGAAKNRGFDVSFTAQPVAGLTLRGNYSYLDAKLTEDVPGLLSVQGGDRVDALAGDRLPGSTKNSGALGATYEVPVGDDSVALNWTATYTGSILTRIGQRGGGEALPSYVLHRANVTYRTDAYELGLFATNIFDKYAVTGVGNDLTRRGFVNDGVIYRGYTRAVAQPRVIGVEGRYRF